MFALTSKYRNVIFTLNNYTQDDVEKIRRWEVSYLVFGMEVGEEGTPHLQGYVEWKNPKRGSTLKNLNDKIHWERRLGTAKQAADYCKKDGKYEEFGELSEQGKRTDLDDVKDAVMSGRKVDDIAVQDPYFYHQYGRTLNKLEDLAMRKKFRTEMTKGIWYYGPTGVGKSTIAFEGYTPETHYVVPNDSGWWDGYVQQEKVIINDFRGEIPYNQLLQMVDRFPYHVKRRGREPMPFTSRLVVITSSLPPETIYRHRAAEDSIDQLKRRFKIINLGPDTEVVEGNTKTSTDTEVPIRMVLEDNTY